MTLTRCSCRLLLSPALGLRFILSSLPPASSKFCLTPGAPSWLGSTMPAPSLHPILRLLPGWSLHTAQVPTHMDPGRRESFKVLSPWQNLNRSTAGPRDTEPATHQAGPRALWTPDPSTIGPMAAGTLTPTLTALLCLGESWRRGGQFPPPLPCPQVTQTQGLGEGSAAQSPSDPKLSLSRLGVLTGSLAGLCKGPGNQVQAGESPHTGLLLQPTAWGQGCLWVLGVWRAQLGN